MKLTIKIVIKVTLFLIFAFLIFATYSIKERSASIEDDIIESGNTISRTVSYFCVAPLLVDDYPNIETNIENMIREFPYILAIEVYHGETDVANQTPPADKIKYKKFTSSIESSGEIGKVVVYLEDNTKEIIRDMIYQYILFFILFFTVLWLSLMLLIKYQILNKIELLSSYSKVISDGNYKKELKLNSKDELSQLANNLTLMSREIDIKHKELNELNKSLEKQIEVKTKRLSISNEELRKNDYELKLLNENLQEQVDKEVEKNRQKDRHLIHQSRLAQMGEMLSMIAHQWRQPLAAISATTNNLTFKLIIDDVDKKLFREEIALIADYSQHLSKTIEDFRGFFKEDREKEATSLEEIVNSTLNIVKASIQNKNIKINVELNCNKKFETYPSEIKQVLLNIIKNAEDVLLDNKIENPTITIKTSCSDKNYLILIKDNAGGVPKEIKERIFDPYFSTKLKKDGTGLGLYMSKTIIEKHCGGKLTLSNDEFGAVFKIELKGADKNG